MVLKSQKSFDELLKTYYLFINQKKKKIKKVWISKLRQLSHALRPIWFVHMYDKEIDFLQIDSQKHLLLFFFFLSFLLL